MAEWVYVFCFFTSLTCCYLLSRGYRRTRTRLLFWSALCFGGFTLNNLIVFVDLAILGPALDLSIPRNIVSLLSISALVYGLVTEETAQ